MLRAVKDKVATCKNRWVVYVERERIERNSRDKKEYCDRNEEYL